MSKDDFTLSRRKALAALGTIGAASAGAGFGTSAYFSDQETFENNRLVAGELDLKVDWEEHYSDWSPDENTDRSEADGGESPEDDGEGEFNVLMEAPDNPEQYLAFPPGASEPLLWVPDAYVDDFMDNTSIEGYPDSNNDGIAEFPVEEMQGMVPCEFLADVGDDDAGLDPDSHELGRSDNEDTRLDDGSPAPLINLQDVKPGDFGEITFSTHLCDNDGYLWMNMPDGLDASENGFTEPEADDPDEDGPGGDVELVEELQTALWYDNNCDNLITKERKVDLFAVVDTSESIEGDLRDDVNDDEIDLLRETGNGFLNAVQNIVDSPDELHAGLMSFNGGADEGVPETDPTVDNKPVLRADLGPIDQFDTDDDGDFDIGELDDEGDPQFLPSEGFGDTPMPHALDLAQKLLNDQGRPDAAKCILLVTDGLPEYENESSYQIDSPESGTITSETFSAGQGTSVERAETAEEAEEVKCDGISIVGAGIGLDNEDDSFLINNIVGDDCDPTTAQPDFYFDIDLFGNLPGIADDVAQKILGKGGESETDDEVIFTGTLDELETELTANGGRGIPLDGLRSTPFDELNDPEDSSNRECFTATTTACFGLSWWLPENHGNEVQSDGVSFDIGFYTEQCRHNDGGGLNNEDIDPEEIDA